MKRHCAECVKCHDVCVKWHDDCFWISSIAKIRHSMAPIMTRYAENARLVFRVTGMDLAIVSHSEGR